MNDIDIITLIILLFCVSWFTRQSTLKTSGARLKWLVNWFVNAAQFRDPASIRRLFRAGLLKTALFSPYFKHFVVNKLARFWLLFRISCMVPFVEPLLIARGSDQLCELECLKDLPIFNDPVESREALYPDDDDDILCLNCLFVFQGESSGCSWCPLGLSIGPPNWTNGFARDALARHPQHPFTNSTCRHPPALSNASCVASIPATTALRLGRLHHPEFLP